jgi:hypothetical protein
VPAPAAIAAGPDLAAALAAVNLPSMMGYESVLVFADLGQQANDERRRTGPAPRARTFPTPHG